MGRFFLILVLATAIAGGVAYYYEWGPWATDQTTNPSETQELVAVRTDLGKALYQAKAPAFAPIMDGADLIDHRGKRVVVPDCHLQPINKQEACSVKDGWLLVIGEPQDSENPMARKALPTISIWVNGKKQEYAYDRLKEGAVVKEGQIVALVDPTKALNDIVYKTRKISAAEADNRAANAMADEAKAKVTRLDDLKRINPKLVNAEEYSGAKLTQVKYEEEAKAKLEQVKVAQVELNQAIADWHQYEIRCMMTGKSLVKQIYKGMGDGVKNLEPVMQLVNISRLRAEGSVDAPYYYRLAGLVKRARVVIEPTHEMAPETPSQIHKGEITGVAVAGDGKTYVSGSEDRTICVWQSDQGGLPYVLRHTSPVRAVACTPAGAERNLCAAGLADGRIVLWDLSQVSKPGVKPILVINDGHRDPVSALAFSPNGRWLASGGHDSMIYLWDWKNQKDRALYGFHPDRAGLESSHNGPVTALHFTPDGKVVSAARDNTLRVWKLHEKGAALQDEPIAGRVGTVSNPGVTANGNLMVYDQGRTLQLLSVKDQRTMAELNNSLAGTQFETFALFSPDGALMLTAGAPEGRMQLWRTPSQSLKDGKAIDLRGFEVRQLVPAQHGAVTCAAFAPDGSFAVSGNKDGYVHFWKLPTTEEIKSHRITTDKDGQPLTLTHLDSALDAGKVRIGVEVDNVETREYPNGRLIPGRRVTVVIEP